MNEQTVDSGSYISVPGLDDRKARAPLEINTHVRTDQLIQSINTIAFAYNTAASCKAVRNLMIICKSSLRAKSKEIMTKNSVP